MKYGKHLKIIPKKRKKSVRDKNINTNNIRYNSKIKSKRKTRDGIKTLNPIAWIIRILTILIILMCMFNINDTISYLTDIKTITNKLTVEGNYTVTFDSNTGTGTMNPQEISYNVATNLTANGYTKNGYTFDNWNTESDGSGTTYTNGQSVTNLEDITLYAQWRENNYQNTTSNKYYVTLTEALTDINNSEETETQTIQVLRSKTEPAGNAPTLAANKKATIDLNGKTTTLNSTLTNNGTLEIKDTQTGGTITRAGDVITNNASNSSLTVNGGTITATNRYGIYNKATATVNVNGGSISGHTAIYNDTNSTINVSGEDTTITGTNGTGIRGYTGRVIVSGGTISNSKQYYSAILVSKSGEVSGSVLITGGNISASATYGYGVNNAGDGTVEIRGGTISAKNGYGVGNSGQGTIEVTGGSISGGNGIYNEANGTINVSGENTTITGTNGSAIRGYTGRVTVSGGTISISPRQYTNAISVTKSGEVSGSILITGGTISASGAYCYGVYNGGDETLEIRGGNISVSDAGSYGIYNAGNATVEISGGTIANNGSYGVGNGGQGTINVTGGSISGANGIYNTANGAINVSGANTSITGTNGHGIRGYAGSVTVTDATVSATQSAIYVQKSGEVSGSVLITGGNISSIGTNGNTSFGINNAGDGTVEIRGGTISAKGFGLVNSGQGTITITGGSISGSNGIKNEANGTINVSGEDTSITGRDGYCINGYTGSVTVTDGTISAQTYAISVSKSGEVSGSVLITGGNILSTGNNANICRSVINGGDGIVEIRGGTISCNKGYGVESQGQGTINITGGSISGISGIYNAANGTINVSGANTSIIGTNGNGIRGYIGSVTVTDGTISGTFNGISVEKANDIAGSLTLGTNDSSVSKTAPEITSSSANTTHYGVYVGDGATFNFYDGKIVARKNGTINTDVTAKPVGYQVVKTTDANNRETAVLEKEI